MRVFRCLLCVLALVVACCGVCPAAPSPIPVIGTADFERLLAATEDKVVVLNVFASWCGPCRIEIPELIRVRQRYPVEKVSFLGLSVDSDAAALDALVAKMKFNYPVYRDNGSIAQGVGVSSIPLNIVLDGKGKLVLRQEGRIPEAMLIKVIDEALRGGK